MGFTVYDSREDIRNVLEGQSVRDPDLAPFPPCSDQAPVRFIDLQVG